jgi:hypothetical protein
MGSVMSEANCSVQNTNHLTVGAPFDVYCSATSPDLWAGITPDNAVLKTADADKYKIVLLKLDFANKDQIHLVVTSYKPGSHNLNGVQLLSHDAAGDHAVTLSPIPFSVASVIDPKNPPKEPYGALGPMRLSLPFWYWLVVAGVLAVFALIVAARLWQRSKKRKLLAKMRIFETAQTPFFQFHQQVRKALRDIGFVQGDADNGEIFSSAVKNLNEAYRVYLGRTFLVPALDWNEKQILSDLKKHHRSAYEDERAGFKKSLAELSRAQAELSRQGKLSVKDVEQLIKLVRDHVDRIDRGLQARKAGR